MTRVLPRFPARVRGINALSATTENGVLTIGIDPTNLAESADPTAEGNFTVIFNSTSNELEKAEVASTVVDIATEAEAEAGTDNQAILSALRGAQAIKVQAENADFTPEGTGAVVRPLYAKMREMVSLNDYSVDKTGATVNTTRIQDWIDDIKGNGSTTGRAKYKGFMEPGLYRASGLVLDRPIHIDANDAAFFSPNGSTDPVITVAVAHDGTDYVTLGNLWAELTIKDLRILGEDRTDAPGVGNVHGIAFQNAGLNPVRSRINLHSVRVNGVPGDSFHGQSWLGVLDAVQCMSWLPGGNGIYVNSCADWRWYGGEAYGALGDNILLAGSVEMKFTSVNVYSAVLRNLNIFGTSQARFPGCSFDLAGRENVLIDLTSTGFADLRTANIRYGSQSADGIYADMFLAASRSGRVLIQGARFEDPTVNPFGPNKPKYNVDFGLSNTTEIEGEAIWGDTGTINSTNVTSNPNRFRKKIGAGYIAPIGGAYKDITVTTEGGEVFRAINVASAVNRFELLGSITGNKVTIKAAGTDADVGISHQTKGAGFHDFVVAGQVQIAVGNGGDGAATLRLDGGTASVPPSIYALGTGADVDLRLSPKGAGRLRTGYATTAAATPANFTADRILEFKDSTGTIYRIPCRASTW